MALQSMNFETYVDTNSDLDTLFNDMYWQEGSLDADKAFNLLLKWAKNEGVFITDADECDYDSILYSAWMATEKGLS